MLIPVSQLVLYAIRVARVFAPDPLPEGKVSPRQPRTLLVWVLPFPHAEAVARELLDGHPLPEGAAVEHEGPGVLQRGISRLIAQLRERVGEHLEAVTAPELRSLTIGKERLAGDAHLLLQVGRRVRCKFDALPQQLACAGEDLLVPSDHLLKMAQVRGAGHSQAAAILRPHAHGDLSWS